MSGNSSGLTKHIFMGVRVGTGGKVDRPIEMLYTPAHRKPDGKNVRARLQIPVLVNVYGKSEPDSFRLVAWGALADIFAKALGKGKEMTFVCDANSYWGNVYNSAGAQILQPDGGALTTRGISFTIREFSWGGDSESTKTEEINAGMKSGEGRRPAQWNIPGTADNLAWKGLLERRKLVFYQGGDRFGFAKVIGPKTPGCEILVGDQSKLQTNTGTAVIAAGGVVGTALPGAIPATGAPLVSEVSHVLNTNTQLPAAAAEGVVV